MFASAALLLAATSATAIDAPPAGGRERASFTRQLMIVRDGREVEVEIGRSSTLACRNFKGVILFFHGANAAPERYRRLTSLWVEGAYLVASPLNVDAERHPARETRDGERIFQTRLADAAALMELATDQHALHGLGRCGGAKPLFVAGHSYGAHIAQLVGGGAVAGIVALSPPPASAWRDAAAPLAPMLVQTGTDDVQPGFVDRWTRRLDSYYAASPLLRWKAVYAGIDHYFGGMIGRPVAAPTLYAHGQMHHFADLSLRFMEFAARRQAGGAGD